MEHKLILGGEQYLPFARSRIKALRATGLEYASQSFEMGDASVKVRIAGEHEYIRLEGGSVEMKMDSGMVGITGGLGEKSIWRDDPGYLIDCGESSAYHALFNTPGKNPGTRINLTKDKNTQLAGDITVSSSRIKGVIREDLDITALPRMEGRPAAPSFSPAWIAVPGSDPPRQEPQAEDGALYRKKFNALLCPASIFTGRCRLYVQALYGLPLYEYEKNYKPGGVRGEFTANVPISDMSPVGLPTLEINSYVATDDFAIGLDDQKTTSLNSYPAVAIDTNCGVMLDKLGCHWLIQLNNGSIRIFPLISNLQGQSLRKHLRPKKDGGLGLNEEAREHLETYILSRCLPDTKNARMLETKYTCGSYSMGYGWHWNWGTGASLTADIVMNETVAPIPGIPLSIKMRSSHYRMVVKIEHLPVPEKGWLKTQKIRESWSAEVETIEDWTEWSIYRGHWCITEPSFSTRTQTKLTPEKGQSMVCDAPFYVFYTRDVINICRVKVVEKPIAKGTRKASKQFCDGPLPNPFDITSKTLGSEPGFVIDRYDSPAYLECEFSIGGTKSPPLVIGRGHTGATIEIKDKTRLEERGPAFTDDGNNPNFYVPIGDPDDAGFYPNQAGPFSGVISNESYHFGWTYVRTAFETLESHTSQAAVVVPMYDSEAVYMYSDTSITKSKSAHTKYTYSLPPGNIVRWTVRSYVKLTNENGVQLNITEGPFDKNTYVPPFNSGLFVQSEVASSTETERIVLTNLLAKGKKIPCEWIDNPDLFINFVDEIDDPFSTISGTSVKNPAVFAIRRGVQLGVLVNLAKDIPISTLGWV